MTEDTIYADADVAIATARVTLTGTTYAVRNITSIKMTIAPPEAAVGGVMMLGIGIVIAITGLSVFTLDGKVALLLLLVGAGFAASAVFLLCGAKNSYSVVLATSAGEVRALTSSDEQYISKIVGYINEAIVRSR